VPYHLYGIKISSLSSSGDATLPPSSPAVGVIDKRRARRIMPALARLWNRALAGVVGVERHIAAASDLFADRCH